MADKELVIRIPIELYNLIQNKLDFNGDLKQKDIKTLMLAVDDGTPLPKGHGRLIDADALKKEYPHDTDWDYPVNTNCSVVESIDNAETIIEADKGYEAKVITHGNCMMCGKELDEGLFFCKECEEKDRKARGKE